MLTNQPKIVLWRDQVHKSSHQSSRTVYKLFKFDKGITNGVQDINLT